ncbi:ABC-F family ATP-binding cassette domain-containing protein [Actinocorallia longicatena]|uniref:ABC-F family ATP-binding cassette domain-containing protein n=1 Tax=Actinocorallia longicatena TaxID=111803 RepID=UPI0031E09891
MFDGLDLVLGCGRTGLIGLNGSGKSTLLRVLAGDLEPASGSVTASGAIGYLPQRLPGGKVEDLLGIAGTRRALAAVEAGDVTDAHLAAIGTGWDLEARARAHLDRLGLERLEFDRPVTAMSGGEAVLTALAGVLLGDPDILLLDEPTNNLDRAARQCLYEVVEGWEGVLVAVSHDRELLGLVDQIAELRDGAITLYGGDFTAYEEIVAAGQETARRLVRHAEQDVRRQTRELTEARTKLDRRLRFGQKKFDTKREPKVIMNARRREAQVSAGKYRNLHTGRLEGAHDRLREAEEEIRADALIRVDLPETRVPAGKTVLELAGLELRGPERVALTGPNGSGKSTLLRRMVPAALVPVGFLPQRLDILDEELSVLDNLRAVAPLGRINALRARLARFHFRGDRADRIVATLSGGERFRAVLATLLSADPAPQLLLLDEPTNNLDLGSLRQLESAINAFEGALVVAGHDEPFLEAIGITRRIELPPATAR